MADGKFISYMRVSTAKQGQSGLGLEAQRSAIAGYLNGGNWALLQEFVEVESGKNNERPKLAAAFEACRLTGARLLIAKLDRLSRDAGFLLGLEKAGVEFVAVDMPYANRLTIGIMAVVADEERRMISARTKAALAAAKERGTILGGFRGGPVVDHTQGTAALVKRADDFAARVGPMIATMRADGLSLADIAARLNERQIRTARGGAWVAMTVKRALDRHAKE
jgi:DNA invertase Pin-like site-specific DNA recombinase